MHPDLAPNGIAEIVYVGGGSYLITLDRPITHGEITTITYDNTAFGGSTVAASTFTYHPGDVNGDGTSAPADILSVIDSLNGVTPLPIERCDCDRDGQAAPADILCVIDLLTGAGAFEPWNGAVIDPGKSP
jgi:hypothetical protein